jgi:aminoglycoside 6'-N-acetyltransferase
VRVPDAPLEGELAVVRVATEADADLLARWHRDPEVARFWDDEVPTRAEIVRDLADPDVDPYLVEEAGVPVGYLQAWFDHEEADAAGLDLFLIPEARGRGLGPDAARTLARWLLAEAGLSRLTVDPYVTNDVAVRAWRKAGFRPVQEREPDEDHTKRWLLMRADRRALGLEAG